MNIRGKIKEISLIALILLLMVFIRIFIGSFLEYSKANDLKVQGKYDFAVIHYTRAVRWYTPFNPFVKKSLKELSLIASEYEKNNDHINALHTWEDLRSAIYSVRSFYTPFKDYIKISNDRIANIRTNNGISGLAAGNETKSQTRKRILKQLRKDYAPSTFFSILSLLGFFGWIASTLCFIFFVLGSDNANRRKALILGVSFFVFYILWLMGLAKA